MEPGHRVSEETILTGASSWAGNAALSPSRLAQLLKYQFFLNQRRFIMAHNRFDEC
jgi:hypothetical protein